MLSRVRTDRDGRSERMPLLLLEAGVLLLSLEDFMMLLFCFDGLLLYVCPFGKRNMADGWFLLSFRSVVHVDLLRDRTSCIPPACRRHSAPFCERRGREKKVSELSCSDVTTKRWLMVDELATYDRDHPV